MIAMYALRLAAKVVTWCQPHLVTAALLPRDAAPAQRSGT
jgi:hypothetical protein